MAKSAAAKAATVDTADAVKVNPIADSYKLDDLMKEYKTKSAVIRFLNSKEHTRSHIAKFMGIRYQHVRNVLVADLEKASA